jgi:hypothetical protein
LTLSQNYKLQIFSKSFCNRRRIGGVKACKQTGKLKNKKMEEVLIPLIIFGTIFGILYVFFTTRNKERLALIEKGADAKLFNTGKSKSGWMKVVLNIGLLAIGIGAGVLLGGLLEMAGLDDEMAYPSMIFICGGIGLVVGFFMNKKLETE